MFHLYSFGVVNDSGCSESLGCSGRDKLQQKETTSLFACADASVRYGSSQELLL